MEICAKSSKNSEGFVDRSKVRILLCENDAKSSEHVFNLLVNCAYQVTSVKSARQVIDALNAVGPDIDIILAEVDLPMAKGMKMLKYISRDKDLRRIPVIMMSAQDEVSLVVKCLRLGAADYLVKPLRTNELLNLWTHMWRRRRMLGLAEKNVILYDFDVVGSDPSDANTTSTTLFSDDTDDKSRKKANPEISMCMSFHNEDTNAVMPSAVIAVEPPFTKLFGYQSGVPGINDCGTGLCSPGPKKSEWKVGECSAFFTYEKSSIANITSPQFAETSIPDPVIINRVQTWKDQKGQNIQTDETVDTWEKSSQGDDLPITISSSAPDSHSLDNRSSSPASNNSKEKESSQRHLCPRNELQPDVSNLYAHSHHPPYPYFMPGMVNQVMAPYPMNFHGMQHFSHLTQCPPPHVQYPYHQVNMYVPPGQIPNPHPWYFFGNGVRSFGEVKTSKVDRREAALLKFRQKRKERCFGKKIRYVNRKRLAERRPRVRGQFVRKMNGVNVDLNGRPDSGDFEEEDDEGD